MADISITALAIFFSDEPKSIDRGENHYKSGHIEYFTFSSGIIRGIVHASMKNKSYKATVYLDGNKIRSTECECPRGAYKCSHSVALIIYAIHNLSRTDVECTWKKQKAPIETKSVEEMYPAKEYNPFLEEPTDIERDLFYDDLKRYGKFTGMAWILSPEPLPTTLPIQTVEEIILSEEFVNHDLRVDYLLDQLKVSEEQRDEVSKGTIGQRENPSWHMLRKGRLTASNFGVVLKAKRCTASLLKRVLGEYDLSGVQSIMWGINNEEEGLKAFTSATNLKVDETGLWLTLSGILGASPDGLVGHDAVVEVKCPFTQRNSTIEEAISTSKDFCLHKGEDGRYKLKQDHVYWHQVQGQLHLTNRNICYFITWTTKQCLIIRIPRDPSWAVNLDLLEDFYTLHVVPKLIEG